MGFIDKAKEFVSNNPDKVNQGIDKAGDAIDAKTGGQYEGQVDAAQDKARDFLGSGEGAAPQAAPEGAPQEGTPE